MADFKHDPEIDKLITELGKSRKTIEGYVAEVEVMKGDVLGLFPSKLDFRNKQWLEDKLKTTSTFFSTMLSMRQEINKTILQEIDARRKRDVVNKIDGPGADIRELAEILDKKGFRLQVKEVEESPKKSKTPKEKAS